MNAAEPNSAPEPNMAELSQWFTPDYLARKMVTWAGLPPGARVLEPSAGNGAIVHAGPDLRWTAIEIDPRLTAEMRQRSTLIDPVNVIAGDFLNYDPTDDTLPRFDAVIMNPPYEHGRDVAHVLHALKFAPRVIALLRSVTRHGENRWRDLWAHVDPVREANLVGRPHFGGPHKPRADFTVWEFRPRVRVEPPSPVGNGAHPLVEWWCFKDARTREQRRADRAQVVAP